MPKSLLAVMILAALVALSCEDTIYQTITGPEYLSDPSVLPAVLYTYPPANSIGPYPDLYLQNWGSDWPQIQLRFNKFMDISSVRRAVGLRSSDGNIAADSNLITSIGGDVFIIPPVDSLGYRISYIFRIGQLCTMTIDSAARDINGNRLTPAYSMTFLPEPFFRVRRVIPADGAKDVATTTTISLTFNSRIDTSILPSVHLDPDAGGKWVMGWDSSVIYYAWDTYGGALPNAVNFTVSIDSGAADHYGNRLPGRFLSRFATRPFGILNTEPRNGQTDVHPGSTIVVYCNSALDTSSIRGSVSIDPPTDGSWYCYPGSTAFYFSPSNNFDGGTTYTVRIDTTLRSEAGSFLPAPFEFAFSTVAFGIAGTQPGNGVTSVDPSNPIEIWTTAPVDRSTIRSSVRFEPPLPYYLSAADGAMYFVIYPERSLAVSASYTVTIDTLLRSTGGTPLGSPYTFSFSTAPLAVKDAYPQNGSTDVVLSGNVEIRFNAAIDSASATGAFSVTPAVPGNFFVSTKEMYFYPSEFAPRTRYTVSIDTTLRALEGGSLPAPYSFSFTTLSFGVYYTHPANGDTGHPVNFVLYISFSGSLDTSSIDGSFEMRDSTGTLVPAGFLYYRQNPYQILIDPYAYLEPGMLYTVTISTSVRSKGGNVPEAPYIFSFRTAR